MVKAPNTAYGLGLKLSYKLNIDQGACHNAVRLDKQS